MYTFLQAQQTKALGGFACIRLDPGQVETRMCSLFFCTFFKKKKYMEKKTWSVEYKRIKYHYHYSNANHVIEQGVHYVVIFMYNRFKTALVSIMQFDRITGLHIAYKYVLSGFM